MKAVDTNILVHFLTADDKAQASRVYALLKRVETEKSCLLVPLLVVLELVGVLESAYDLARSDIVETLGELLLMPVLKFEQHSVVQQFTSSARGNNLDLSDLLIACIFLRT